MKVGDKIRCKKNYDYLFVKGKIYTIVNIKEAWWDPVYFKEIEIEGHYSTGEKFTFPFILCTHNRLKSPSPNLISKYFYSPKEERKFKLKNLKKIKFREKIKKFYVTALHILEKSSMGR